MAGILLLGLSFRCSGVNCSPSRMLTSTCVHSRPVSSSMIMTFWPLGVGLECSSIMGSLRAWSILRPDDNRGTALTLLQFPLQGVHQREIAFVAGVFVLDTLEILQQLLLRVRIERALRHLEEHVVLLHDVLAQQAGIALRILDDRARGRGVARGELLCRRAHRRRIEASLVMLVEHHGDRTGGARKA